MRALCVRAQIYARMYVAETRVITSDRRNLRGRSIELHDNTRETNIADIIWPSCPDA